MNVEHPILVEQVCRGCFPGVLDRAARWFDAWGDDVGPLLRCEVFEDRRGRLHLAAGCTRRMRTADLTATELIDRRWCGCGNWDVTRAGHLALQLVALWQALDGDDHDRTYRNWNEVLGVINGRRHRWLGGPPLPDHLLLLTDAAREAELRRARRSCRTLDHADLHRGALYWLATRDQSLGALRIDASAVTCWTRDRWSQTLTRVRPTREPKFYATLDAWLDAQLTRGEVTLVTRSFEHLAFLHQLRTLFWAFGEQISGGVWACRVPRAVAEMTTATYASYFAYHPDASAAGPERRTELESAVLLWTDGGPVYDSFDACVAAARRL